MSERAASQPLFAVETHWDVGIEASDGTRLSANLWRPVTDDRVPAILEMIPYGKDNWRRNADVARGGWLAARGFALCRIDVRGTGSSQGIALDEYTEAETRDGVEVVAWLAAQPWSNGNVGMWGISYGGFTSIQVAARRPPALKAIAPMYATDDRYLDDVHYRGGCRTVSEMSQYAVSQLGMNAMPPDLGFLGGDRGSWERTWRERLEQTPPWLLRWFREQTDGPYWRQGSLAPRYEDVEAAIYHIAGWNDSYVDAAVRMQERCTRAASRRVLIGNWVHSFPDDAYPGPNLDWLHELVRFFDRYLKDERNGWEDEPSVAWFERDYATPEPFPPSWPGRWRAAAAMPVPGITEASWWLGASTSPGVGTLRSEPSEGTSVERLPHRATVGTSGSLSWGAGWHPNGLARDLRPDEARSLTWTTAPLDAPVAIIGIPVAVLHVAASMPVATVSLRLSDVAPDGTSALVTAGVLNLTHRRSHATPQALEPGVVEEVVVPLRASGYRWAPGHRIRLTIATSSWPVLWPSPFSGELHVHHSGVTPSRLVLPVLPDTVATLDPPVFKTAPAGVTEVGGGTEDEAEWRIEEDPIAGTVTVRIFEGGSTILPDGRELDSSERLAMTTSDADPAHTRFATDVVYRWREHGADVDIRATGTITSDVEAFDLDVALDVRLDDAPFFDRRWRERVPRRLV